MVMTAPSRMVIWEANDRTTEGVRAGCEGLAMRAAGSGGVWCASRVVTASLSLVIARHERGRVRGACWWASLDGRAMRPTRA